MGAPRGMHELLRIYTNLIVMPSTMQTRGMHTKIRSRDTPRQDGFCCSFLFFWRLLYFYQPIFSVSQSVSFFCLEALLEILRARGYDQSWKTVTFTEFDVRQEFAFFADRLIRLVVEAALGHLPFAETEVMTPVGEPYQGAVFVVLSMQRKMWSSRKIQRWIVLNRSSSQRKDSHQNRSYDFSCQASRQKMGHVWATPMVHGA